MYSPAPYLAELPSMIRSISRGEVPSRKMPPAVSASPPVIVTRCREVSAFS